MGNGTSTQAESSIPNDAAVTGSGDDDGVDVEESSIVSQEEIESFFGKKVGVTISRQVFELRDEISQIRRYFHMHPELSFKEEQTSQNIIGYLTELGIEVETCCETGVIGTLHGKFKGNCILLRSDMDALPINESKTEYNEKYISKNEGVMHACGHDAHMAILLGTARVLQKLKDYLHGSVKFLFQCAEEAGAGAKMMIESKDSKTGNGILKTVDQVYGLHVWSYIPFGKCIVKSGALMAGCVLFEIELIGKGGHGAIPKGTKDSVLASAHLISQLHSIISRNILATERGVLTIGKIDSGFRSNVISQSARISGTIRWFDNEIYGIILNRIDQILRGIETSFDVKCSFKLTSNVVPPVVNSDEQCVFNVKSAVEQVLTNGNEKETEKENENENDNGSNNTSIIENAKATMVSEDFSYFLEKRPGCFFLLGCGMDDDTKQERSENKTTETNDGNDENDENDGKKTESKRKALAHHTANFEIDERCLMVGTQIMCTLVLDLLLPHVAEDDAI